MGYPEKIFVGCFLLDTFLISWTILIEYYGVRIFFTTTTRNIQCDFIQYDLNFDI